jgi:hypothetical protein
MAFALQASAPIDNKLSNSFFIGCHCSRRFVDWLAKIENCNTKNFRLYAVLGVFPAPNKKKELAPEITTLYEYVLK